jgi:hypothetical protein
MQDHRTDGGGSPSTTCDGCGAEGPLTSEPGSPWSEYCPTCAAKMSAYDNGWRGGALLAVGRAVENALAAPDCTPDQIREAVEVALAGNTHSDFMLSLAENIKLPAFAFEPRGES